MSCTAPANASAPPPARSSRCRTLGGDTHTPALSGLMGHGDARTTLIYTGRRMADMRDAAERIGRRMTGKGRAAGPIVTPIVTPAAETPGG